MTSHWTWDGSKFTFGHAGRCAKRTLVGLVGAVTTGQAPQDADLTEFLIHFCVLRDTAMLPYDSSAAHSAS